MFIPDSRVSYETISYPNINSVAELGCTGRLDVSLVQKRCIFDLSWFSDFLDKHRYKQTEVCFI